MSPRTKGAALRQRPTHDGYNCPKCTRRWQSWWHHTRCTPPLLSSPKAPKARIGRRDPQQSTLKGPPSGHSWCFLTQQVDDYKNRRPPVAVVRHRDEQRVHASFVRLVNRDSSLEERAECTARGANNRHK